MTSYRKFKLQSVD